MPQTQTALVVGDAKPTAPTTNSPLVSQADAPTKKDPLANPDSFVPSRLEDKTASIKDSSKGQAAGTALATDGVRVPLGAGSVIAAANGGDPRYLPVPLVTMPPTRPPMPPVSSAPQPPDPTRFVNAFTPPMSQEEQQAFAFAMAQQQQRQLAPMMVPPYPMPPGNPALMARGYGPMPMGYQGPMPPSPVGNMQGYPMPMPQPQPYPMPMMAQPYPMPMMPMQPAMVYANPAMDRPGMPVAAGLSMQQSINILQSSIFPTQRETAVIQLSTCDWRTYPQIVNMLLTTAKEDPAAMVRVAAVSGLGRMGIATDAVITTFNQLKHDSDARVRLEAEQALTRMVPATGVQPAGGVR